MRMRFTVCVISFLILVSGGPKAFGQAAGQNQSASEYRFGTQKISTTSAPIPITLKNPAQFKVKFAITPDKESKPDFQIDKNGCEADVAAGASCAVEITFAPRAKGDRTSTWQVSYQTDSKGKSIDLAKWTLSGTGIFPDLTISSGHLSFEPRQISSAGTPQTITLANNSQKDIKVSKIFTTGDFTMELPTPAQPMKQGDPLLVLKPNDSVAVVVSFNPKRDGNATGMLTIVSDASESPQNVELSGSTEGMLSALCTESHICEIVFIILLCFLYWLGMITTRWHRIARPTRELLRAQIISMRAEVGTAPDKSKEAGLTKITDLLDVAKNLIDPADRKGKPSPGDFFNWSRGQEMGGWGLVHEAKVHMAQFLDDETVKVRLETAEQRLRVTNDAGLLALADAIHQELSVQPPTNANPERRKAQLAEALSANYGRDDTKFADMVSWQNKAAWLVVSGLLIMVALTIAIPHRSILLVVGGTGGLISRLTRSLDRKDVPTDYGASWTTLFLSPVSGALGAWAGILISGLAVQLNVLGSAFSKANWDEPCQPTTMAIALLFGFSERLLDSVLDKIATKAGGDQGTTIVPQPPQKPLPPHDSHAAAGGGLTIKAKTLGDGKVGADYNETLEATGNTGKVVWSLKAGADAPAWLRVGDDGKLTGKPTDPGPVKFTVEAKDDIPNGSKASEFTINIS